MPQTQEAINLSLIHIQMCISDRKKTVCQIVEEWLEGKDYFLVEVTVSPDDKIVVEIDHAEGVCPGFPNVRKSIFPGKNILLVYAN